MEATRAICLRPLSKQRPSFAQFAQESRRLLPFLRGQQPNQPSVRSTEYSTPKCHPDNPSNTHSTLNKDTEKHLSSILDHPLFRIIPDKPLPRKGQQDKVQDTPNVKRKLSENPLGLLDELIASGRADHNTLLSCLKAHSSLPHFSPKPSNAIESSTVGSRIVAWYSAADLKSRLCFFGSCVTMSMVVPYMVAGRLQYVIMDWVKMLSTPISPDFSRELANTLLPSRRLCLTNLLHEFVTAEIKHGHGIQSALKYFIRTCELLPPGDKFWNGRRNPFCAALRSTGCQLAACISSHSQTPDVQGIPVELFEEFCRLSDHLSKDTFFWGARLPLYHPTNPDAQPALSYLKRMSLQPEVQIRPGRRKHLLRLSLDAAQLFLEQKQYSEASWLLAHAKQFIGDERFASEQSSERSNPQATLASGLLLNGICLQ
ncbi:hypothetical protein PAAG_02003 [Paracoccidioides lutzii Pb01]|uniref:Uncharacterized protein n=1 Tax=Paracoccidioides lutzii (strain ATCC MYA-826 / Pb01) TaxID=502779 RepID=C1GU08_PARBA|nr:hypothetical protein PAAG_02003 [Paracoccidioides lutzii Pb01]EEH39814.1 hypothetical protein PAAG_02003 [Paracoccidioides lutzii Pb01]